MKNYKIKKLLMLFNFNRMTLKQLVVKNIILSSSSSVLKNMKNMKNLIINN